MRRRRRSEAAAEEMAAAARLHAPTEEALAVDSPASSSPEPAPSRRRRADRARSCASGNAEFTVDVALEQLAVGVCDEAARRPDAVGDGARGLPWFGVMQTHSNALAAEPTATPERSPPSSSRRLRRRSTTEAARGAAAAKAAAKAAEAVASGPPRARPPPPPPAAAPTPYFITVPANAKLGTVVTIAASGRT